MACYYRNGTHAVDDTPCPNANTCCPSGATCTDNLLCRDKNNHANGSLTNFPDGHSYNYTGLYYTPSCQDKSYKGCSIACTTYDSYRGQYIWACNAALTRYCCHEDEASLGQGDCCEGGTFELAAPVSGSPSVSASASASATSSSSSMLASAPSASVTSSAATATAAATTSLSTGAKAGIGVGAAGAGIIIIVLVALLLRARRLAANTPGQSQSEKNTFWTSGARARARRAELESCAYAPPSELSAKPAPSRFELGS
ncbi:uncharacterized protein NFIA_106640 [Aspergillus fischeri NRRL 181]|uniref:Uncharacterized protein n=1 Tax=Neosartorya fischeri (strain ATCC 1020 / DSM 3700 / CBS 544.65 / FGSC A1164 / JCM 1740 / NRRL 181 / WB 181) TaxID=331117 RepID=A1CX24_NEOFI|nr:uncharacterized protein NFIA_106640 [Aspergillus fischeri NRRL 181]EAW25176.1 hypothetical protein NFIA_106640 [Aspergillus fischeri NRRL 181]KAG2027050.1 hypothetical protein GB937_000786 [Aspergillus fischeri]